MYELIKGNMVMHVFSKEDKDMYEKNGWKFVAFKKVTKKKAKESVVTVENSSNNGTIEG